MARVYIGIGSNIDPEHNVREAIRLLREMIEIKAISTFYRTEPIGTSCTQSFYNGVVEAETDVEPRKLKFGILRRIEELLSRVRTQDKYAPRTIDLDIVIYGDKVLHEPGIEIPDPDIFTRPFIAAPLFELAQDLVIPGSNTRLADILKDMPVDSMLPLPDFTYTLTRIIHEKCE